MPTSQQFKEKRFQLLTRAVSKHRGALLDRGYEKLDALVSLRCERGHRFKLTGKNVLRGMWCARCRPLARQTEYLRAAQTTARARGGKCLATAYENARTSLQWSCKAGHRWRASLDNVVGKGSWCPECAVLGAGERKKKWWRAQRLARRTRA